MKRFFLFLMLCCSSCTLSPQTKYWLGLIDGNGDPMRNSPSEGAIFVFFCVLLAVGFIIACRFGKK